MFPESGQESAGWGNREGSRIANAVRVAGPDRISFLAISHQPSGKSKDGEGVHFIIDVSLLIRLYLPQKCPASPGAECESPARKCRVGRQEEIV